MQNMPPLHHANIGRTQKLIGYTLSILASVMVFSSALFKFTGEANIYAVLERLGVQEYALSIGLAEMLIVLIYWIPRTSNLGFFLFCSYIGAITVAEMLMGDFPLPGLTIGGMIYLGTLLRKPTLL